MSVLATTHSNIHWFMPSTKTKCYSYIRWSSDKQAKGTTLERQLKTAQEIADDNGLELVEIIEIIEIIDSGISAFKGKNTKDGELGRFIDAVDNGLIPSESWLVVENLDRLSREDILSAQRLFMTLLELGLTVVTGMDKKIYTKQSVTDNPMELMYSIMLFSRAHDESSTKSIRTNKHARARITDHKEGKRADNGYAIAIKSVGTNMWWSDCSDGSVKPHPVYFAIAQEMVRMALDGIGSFAITKYLNETYPAPLPKTKLDEGETGIWSLNRANQFFVSRTLIGPLCQTSCRL